MRIYCLLNRQNGKIYIGKTVRDDDVRINEYFKFAAGGKNHCPYLYKAIRHYGKAVFEVGLLSAYASSKSDLNAQEIHYIKKYRANEPEFGYNLTLGGDGLSSPSTVVRQKMSLAKRGKKQSAETIVKRSQAMLGNKNCLGRIQTTKERQMRSLSSPHRGIPLSEERKARLSEVNQGKGGRLSALGRKWIHNPFTGKEKLMLPCEVLSFVSLGWRMGGSPERHAKMAASKTGKSQSPETIARRAAKLCGKTRTEEQRKRMSDAAKARGVSMEHISLMVRKRQEGKIVNGD